jgi:hypothetical protein
MDPVNCFVERALDAVTYLDYVAKCCQTCDREFADSLIGNDLASYRLQRRFGDLEPLFRPHGIDGADPATAARWVQVNVDRTIDGLEIDRDWRAWWNVRSPILDAIQWLRESAPYPIAPPDFGTGATPMPSDESSTPASSTPSVHDIALSLTDNAPLVIQALSEADAFNRQNRLVGDALCRKAGVTRKQLEKVMAFDKRLPCRCIESIANRTGGYWLTPFGKEVSTALEQTTPGEVTG